MQDGPGESHVAELDRLLREGGAREAGLRRAQLLATLGLVAVLGVAVATLYAKAREMYTTEHFQACLPEQLEQLRPALESTAMNVVDRTAPHYARMGQERLERLLPALGAKVRVELDGMSASLAQRAERKVALTMAAVEQRQVDRLHALYPDLGERELALLRNKWAREIQEDTELVLTEFHERAMTDFTLLGTTIESFAPSRFTDMARDDLVRYYAHLWLSLVDEQLLAGVGEGGRDG